MLLDSLLQNVTLNNFHLENRAEYIQMETIKMKIQSVLDYQIIADPRQDT